MGAVVAAFLLFADARSLFERGVSEQKAGDLRAAEKSFAEASAADPDNYAILGNLGVVRAQLGEFRAAEAAYRRALELNPRAHRLRLNLGIAYFKQSEFQASIDELKRFLAAEPANAQAQELLALSLIQAQRHAEADAILGALIAASGEKLPYLYALGQAQIQGGNPAAGEKTFHRLFTLYPDTAEAHMLQAQAQLADKAFESALGSLEKARGKKSELPGLSLWQGIALEGLGRTDEALAAYTAEIALTADPIACYAAGILQSRLGNSEAAVDLLRRAIPLDSERYNVSYYLGRALTKLGQFKEALPYAKASAARNPESVTDHNALLAIYRGLGLDGEARKEAALIRGLQRKSLDKDRETVEKRNSRPVP